MKKITLLFAIMACSFGMLNAANVKVRVLIPSDTEFNTSGDVIFSWEAAPASKTGPYTNNIVLTRESASRWWGATVIIPDATEFTYKIYTKTSSTTTDETFIMGAYPTSYVAKDKPELNIELMALSNDGGSANRLFACGEVPATTPDHDYSITAWDVQQIGNGVTYTWTATNPAPNYYFELIDETNMMIYGDFHAITDGKFTYNYDGSADVKVKYIIFYPCFYDGTEMRPYAKMFYKIVDIDLKSPATIIKESLKAEQKNNTIEISWTHSDVVARYDAQVSYGGAPVKNFMVLPQYMPATDGKYTLTVDELVGNGAYEVAFFADDKDGNPLANEYLTVNVTGLPALGQVELNVLIPTDNDMDIGFGVWFQWWDVETETKAIVKAEQDADGVWFSQKITTKSSAIRFRVCNASNAKGSNSLESPIIKANKACFEMSYQNAHSWYLDEAACDAPDHDYRITTLNVTSAGTGFLKIEFAAKDYAPYYEIAARKSGTILYKILATLPYSGSNTVQLPSPFTETAEYDYRITPMGGNYRQVAQEKTGTVNIQKNPNVPTDLQAKVASDNQTVTFTWTYSGMGVHHYTLMVDEQEFENITGTSYTQKFYMPDSHYWSLYAYGSTGILLGTATCDDPFEIITPDYDPKNLNVVVNGNTATFTWTAPADVAASRIVLYELGGIEAMNAVVNSSAGTFSATYTLSEDRTVIYDWRVQALTDDGAPMSYEYDGPTFAIVGSTSTDIEEIWSTQDSSPAVKILRNGRILILRDGKTYDMTGRVVEE